MADGKTAASGDVHVLIAESERLMRRSATLRQWQADLSARAAELRAELGELCVQLAVSRATHMATPAESQAA